MGETYTRDQITAIGGNPWSKAGKDRVYLNDWEDHAGLHVQRYNTGNILHFTIDGITVANGRAYRILAAVSSVYWDAIDGKIHVRGRGGDIEVRPKAGGERFTINLPERIRDGIAQAVAEQEKGGDQE